MFPSPPSAIIKADNYYYIAVPPVTLKAGWTIQFTASDGKVYSRKGTNDITFTRNKVTDLGEFATTGDYWYDAARGDIVRADQEVDMGVFEINGKNYRLIFAKSNLTKDGLAANEYDYGDYFAWGATEPWYHSATNTWKEGKEAGYTEANAPTLSKPYKANDVLSSSDDAARQILKGDWQIPTQAIWRALVGITTKGWDEVRKGYTFTNNGQTLFLPAAGYVDLTSFKYVGSYVRYWSGTAESKINESSINAYRLSFNGSTLNVGNSARSNGYPVRPVRLVEE